MSELNSKNGAPESSLDKAGLREAGLRDERFTNPAAQNDVWQRARALWRRLWRRLVRMSRAPRRLRLCENLPLGDRRFVAVVEFEQARFLVGGTAASLVLLARLQNTAGEVADSEAGPPVRPEKERP